MRLAWRAVGLCLFSVRVPQSINMTVTLIDLQITFGMSECVMVVLPVAVLTLTIQMCKLE